MFYNFEKETGSIARVIPRLLIISIVGMLSARTLELYISDIMLVNGNRHSHSPTHLNSTGLEDCSTGLGLHATSQSVLRRDLPHLQLY